MHSILERQLRRLQIPVDGQTLPSLEAWQALLDRISRAYGEADDGRYTLERSIVLSSAEMKELHERLASERDRLRALIGCLGDALLVIDQKGVIQLANSEAGRLIDRGTGDIVGRPIAEVVTFKDRGIGPHRNEDTSFVNASGAVVEVAITTNPIIDDVGAPEGTTIVFRDISARKQLEASLRHAQKLESVGRLAAGIAHEINTPVQFISDNVHFLKESFDTTVSLVERLTDDDGGGEAKNEADWPYLENEVPRCIEQTIEGVRRIATIVQSMKDLARNDHGERTSTDLNAALRNTVVVAGHEFKSVATVSYDLGEIPSVLCSCSDINQVFLTLIVNAAHAVADVVNRDGGIGKIHLTTRCDDGGKHVVISISDTGNGIPEAIRDQLFDPFFTTKVVGRGSGQGLALAHNLIVNIHGGEITFDSVVGAGTTFHVRLPIHGAAAAAAA